MKDQVSNIVSTALLEVGALADIKQLENLKSSLLGKKGSLSLLAGKMRELGPEDRPAFGQLLNEARASLNEAFDAAEQRLQQQLDAASLAGIDLSLPPLALPSAALHPLSIIRHQAISVLRRMGFSLAEGPEIEDEFHCFDALNTPGDHPARNPRDTFYFDSGKLLRTHTSSVQIRSMEKSSLPLRIIAPGSAYRRDEIDATHLSVFNQLEGLYVNEHVTLAELKGTLEYFFHEMFGAETEVRFRPHFFPFTEPSFEIDVKLQVSGQQPRWIEVAGCGMVDPAVFASVSNQRGDAMYDAARVSGFAFGMGLDRLAMIKWGIYDIRLLIENDVRFLGQFA